MNLPDIALYFTAAAIGSVVNSVAGGGTFITFPLLIVGGLGAVQANIVSTIALWPGSVASAFAYKNERKLQLGALRPFLAASVIGGAIGTLILLSTPEQTFRFLVPWLLLGATLIFTFGKYFIRHSRKSGNPENTSEIPASAGVTRGLALQFAIATYGGYFGAGIGILMLAMLQLLGFSNIHQMNGLKSLLGSTINAVAVAIFIFSGRVVWDVAGVMIAGALVGGYFGARLALKVSPSKVRLAVSAVGFAMSAYFFLCGV